MSSLQDEIRRAREACIPTVEEVRRVERVSSEAVQKLREHLPAGVTPLLGGSIAKNTWLKGVKDIDIFLTHENEKLLGEMQREYPHLLTRLFPRVRMLKGSRQYYQAAYEGFTLELVPILRIPHPRDAKNTTDISPFHITFVREHLKQPDEARLFKYWLKQKHAYGAESYQHGLSGYAAELLTIIFSTFEKILHWLAQQDHLPLTPPLAWKNEFQGEAEGMILPDPVLPSRNAAAALNRHKAEHLIRMARACLQNPSSCFKQYAWPYTEKSIKLVLTIPTYQTDDITGAKLEKAFRKAVKTLEVFGIEDTFFHYTPGGRTAEGFVKVQRMLLPAEERIVGPFIKDEKHANAFREKHQGERIAEERGRLVLIRTRKKRRPCDHIPTRIGEVRITCQEMS